MPATDTPTPAAPATTPGEKNPPQLSDAELRALAERVLRLLKQDARIERERQGTRPPGFRKERR